MKQQDFERHFAEFTDRIESIIMRKNADYAGGVSDDDTLANFKEVAGLVGVTPMQVWAVYFLKHVCAVLAFIKKGRVESEGIEGRFHDIANYAVLGLGLVKDLASGILTEQEYNTLMEQRRQDSENLSRFSACPVGGKGQ